MLRRLSRFLERLVSRFYFCRQNGCSDHARYRLVGIWLCHPHAEATIAEGTLE